MTCASRYVKEGQPFYICDGCVTHSKWKEHYYHKYVMLCREVKDCKRCISQFILQCDRAYAGRPSLTGFRIVQIYRGR